MQLSAELAINASGETLEQISKAQALEMLDSIEMYSYIRTVIAASALVILAGACFLGAPVFAASAAALVFAVIAIFVVETCFSDPRIDDLCKKLSLHLKENPSLASDIRSHGGKGASIFRNYEDGQARLMSAMMGD